MTLRLVIVVGLNGAGKTTLPGAFLKTSLPVISTDNKNVKDPR